MKVFMKSINFDSSYCKSELILVQVLRSKENETMC